MNMIADRVLRAFKLTYDLINHLEEDTLIMKLDELPSNRIGEQFWCIIGARESYLKAIKAGGWQGFSCSLKDATSKELIITCLNATESDLKILVADELDDTQVCIMMDLLEHELQHHGQLIRFVYGNKLTFPKSWNDRYTV